MHCPSCGSFIPSEEVLFCETCGLHLRATHTASGEDADLLLDEKAFSQYEPLGIREFSNVFLDLVSGIPYLIPDPETAADTVIFLDDGSVPADVRDYALSEVEACIVIQCGGMYDLPQAHYTLGATPDNAHLCLFGIGKAILEHHTSAIDTGFIERWCLGFEEYQALVQSCSWQQLERQTGISEAAFKQCSELISDEGSLTIFPVPIIELPERFEAANDAIYSSFVPGMGGALGTQNALEPRDASRDDNDDEIPELLEVRRKDVLLTMNILALAAITGSIDTPGGMRIPLSDTLIRLGGNYDIYAPDAFEDTAYQKYEEGELRFDACPGFNTISGKIELVATPLEVWGLTTMPYIEW